MQRVILVVSPDTDFLQQIRSHLEEGGRFQVTCAPNAHDALTLANSNFYEVAILDGELEDIPLVSFSRDLAALQTDLKILVFPPENNPQHPLLEGLVSNGFLTKPFSGPEIGQALTALFSDQVVKNDRQGKQIDELMKQWLQSPEIGGEKAEQILKMTTAQAVLIIIKNQVSASAGTVNDDLISNVTRFLSAYWREDEDNELARFIRVSGDDSDKFLYATKLVSNVVLALIHPYSVTIQKVRRELHQVKDDFQRNYPTTAELRQDIAKQALADIQLRNKALEAMQPFTGAISQSELDILKAVDSKPSETAKAVGVSEEELANLENLFSQMPSPDPGTEPGNPTTQLPEKVTTKQSEWLQESEQTKNQELEELNNTSTEHPPFISSPLAEADAITGVSNNEPSAVIEPLPEIEFKLPWETETEEPINQPITTETAAIPEVSSEIQSAVVEMTPAEPTAPIPTAVSEDELASLLSQIKPQQTEQKDFHFNYTCILIPAIQDQFLTHDLSERLGVILPQFHTAQGWQLTNITIRPQYLLWTVSVPMEVCPHQIIHDIRGLTSAHIFANFPEIAKKKVSDDFWSSNFLAISGTEPPPVNLIFEFVSRSWNKQETSTP